MCVCVSFRRKYNCLVLTQKTHHLSLMWLRSLLHELIHVPPSRPFLWSENLSIVLIAANLVLHARTKHIEIDLYNVWEKVLNRLVDVPYITTIYQTGVVLTKLISSHLFPALRYKLRVESLSTLGLRGAVRVP